MLLENRSPAVRKRTPALKGVTQGAPASSAAAGVRTARLVTARYDVSVFHDGHHGR